MPPSSPVRRLGLPLECSRARSPQRSWTESQVRLPVCSLAHRREHSREVPQARSLAILLVYLVALLMARLPEDLPGYSREHVHGWVLTAPRVRLLVHIPAHLKMVSLARSRVEPRRYLPEAPLQACSRAHTQRRSLAEMQACLPEASPADSPAILQEY